jgi:transcriptional regulator with XRE-family HTH domain
VNGLSYGQKFKRFLEVYRKPDGSEWRPKDIDEETGGFVNANYVTNLKADRFNPRRDRLRAIARVMGFPEALWYEKEEDFDRRIRDESLRQGKATLSEKLNFLIDLMNERRPGRPVTDEEISELTFGKLDEETVAAARRDEVTDLTGAQYEALSNVFGVDVSYWYARPGEVPPLDPATMASLGDEKVRAILHKVHGRPEEQKNLILDLLDQMEPRE